ncbi:hypothetical protein BASA60_009422 [Batrachochytrium salamandrivorans]|nr:hypothetical protein BASA60_009422 [Batrachochytrium salamandrivorans]
MESAVVKDKTTVKDKTIVKDKTASQSLFHLSKHVINALQRVITAAASHDGLGKESCEASTTTTTTTTSTSSIATTSSIGHSYNTLPSCLATCGLVDPFQSHAEMRSHYKSNWHKHNLRLKLRSQPRVSEEEFLLLEAHHPISSDNSETQQAQTEAGLDALPPSDLLQLSIYKQSLLSLSLVDELHQSVYNWASQILSVQASSRSATDQYWTLLMLASGHFAGAVLDCKTGKPIVQKTFHRYTTRRKQGGAQSSNDGSKGNAHSAGAGIRRYNESALQEEVRSLLIEWSPLIKASDALFIRTPGANRAAVYFDKHLIDINDPRVRSFPFTTLRPTHTEIMRCFTELSTVRIDTVVPVIDGDDAKTTTNPKGSRSVPTKNAVPPTAVEAAVPVDPPPSDAILKLMDFCKRGKPELLQTYLSQMDPTTINLVLPDKYGVSLLHIAASNGHANVVKTLLDLGADPTLRGVHRMVRAYDVAQSKPVRDAFRRFMASAMDKWDYADAHISGPLTAEMEETLLEKEREKAVERERRRLIKVKMDEAAEAAAEATEAAAAAVEAEKAKNISARIGGSHRGSSSVGSGASKRLGSAKLTNQVLTASSMTPEQRSRLDREKRALAAEARMKTASNKCGACGKSLVGITPFEKLNFRYCSTDCIQKHMVLF